MNVLRCLMMFFGGGWLAFYCAENLIDFMETGAITWPEIYRDSHHHSYPLLVFYAIQPVAATVAVVITAFGGLMGGAPSLLP
jgi:hypothetical protein